jgi:hypothetical protein
MPVNTYSNEAFEYIGNPEIKPVISNVAAILGVSRTGIAAFIAKENNSYVTTDPLARAADRGLDLIVLGRSYEMSDAEIRGDASQAILFGYPQKIAGLNTAEAISIKGQFISLADVGFANIKITSALVLIDKYYNDNPNSDPLDLRKYKYDAGQLIRDLNDPTKPTVAVVAGLGVREAQTYFESTISPERWQSMPQYRI